MRANRGGRKPETSQALMLYERRNLPERSFLTKRVVRRFDSVPGHHTFNQLPSSPSRIWVHLVPIHYCIRFDRLLSLSTALCCDSGTNCS
jgi:hypothetical protein